MESEDRVGSSLLTKRAAFLSVWDRLFPDQTSITGADVGELLFLKSYFPLNQNRVLTE